VRVHVIIIRCVQDTCSSLIQSGSRPFEVCIVRRVMGDCERRRVYYICVRNFNRMRKCVVEKDPMPREQMIKSVQR
jgi:hypothetical protein